MTRLLLLGVTLVAWGLDDAPGDHSGRDVRRALQGGSCTSKVAHISDEWCATNGCARSDDPYCTTDGDDGCACVANSLPATDDWCRDMACNAHWVDLRLCKWVGEECARAAAPAGKKKKKKKPQGASAAIAGVGVAIAGGVVVVVALFARKMKTRAVRHRPQSRRYHTEASLPHIIDQPVLDPAVSDPARLSAA